MDQVRRWNQMDPIFENPSFNLLHSSLDWMALAFTDNHKEVENSDKIIFSDFIDYFFINYNVQI